MGASSLILASLIARVEIQRRGAGDASTDAPDEEETSSPDDTDEVDPGASG